MPSRRSEVDEEEQDVTRTRENIEGDACQLRPPDTQRRLNYDRAKLVSIKAINFEFNNSPVARGYTRAVLCQSPAKESHSPGSKLTHSRARAAPRRTLPTLSVYRMYTYTRDKTSRRLTNCNDPEFGTNLFVSLPLAIHARSIAPRGSTSVLAHCLREYL